MGHIIGKDIYRKLGITYSNFFPNVMDLGSGRQCCNPAGESRAISIARFRHVVITRLMWETTFSLRDVNGPAIL
jgi:hypothetical protein